MEIPVHESLHVQTATDIYRTDEWWKSVVTYQFDGSGSNETAMYLWHNGDNGWTQKNKYVVKTKSAWETDREIIDRFVDRDAPSGETDAFPVSDYYTVADGETIFTDDGWWKAIVNVVKKGTYETSEVMVYVWQEQDGEWRRRQKYTIKSASDWEEEREIIERHLNVDAEDEIQKETKAEKTEETATKADPVDKEAVESDLSTLGDELDKHLSDEFR
jgi:hypothetical protein